MYSTTQKRDTISRDRWLREVEALQHNVGSTIQEHRERHTRGITHPVYDFLFSYYSFSGGQLLRWTPGICSFVNCDEGDQCDWPDHVLRSGDGFCIDPGRFPAHRIPFLRWAIQFLEKTAERSPVFHCFGMHEWAMLYRSDERRYGDIPLRVSQRELEETIEDTPIRCTHYDAFRFFSDAARPFNKLDLHPKRVTENDQPGCVHANMDLYRLSYKIAPFISSRLMAKLFLLAKSARELDMRASPYDLRQYGFSPIAVETGSGREEYVHEQRLIYEQGRPLREELLGEYRLVLESVLLAYGEVSELS